MAGAGTYRQQQARVARHVATILPDRENSRPRRSGTFKCTTTFCSSLGASDTVTLMRAADISADDTS
jgi:hypothetical protein